MSDLSLLFASQVQSLSNASGIGGEAERETFPSPVWPDAASAGPDDCGLPSGVASMEHWLDLNA